MKNKVQVALLIMLIVGCQTKTETGNSEIDKKGQKELDVTKTEPRVTGIGGIFFKTENPQKMKEWYGKNLGLAIGENGSPFEFRNAHHPDEINYLIWDTFPDTTDYFDPSEKEFMINYRVQNIEGLVDDLKKEGVTVVDEIADYPYGKFVHILDPEGNKIELWEPIDSFLTQLGGKTTK